MSEDPPDLPPVDPALAAAAGSDAVSADALAGLLVDGDEDLVAWALGIALRSRPRAEVYDYLVRDAMRLVGERWTTGRWTISEEHLASRTLQGALGKVAPPGAPSDRIGPTAVLAGVSGEDHVLGLIMLGHVLREVGWSVADLGPNVPADDLARYVARTRSPLVALSATLSERLAVLTATIAALAALPERPTIMVGGRLAERGDLVALGADWASASLGSAASFAADVLARLPEDRGT